VLITTECPLLPGPIQAIQIKVLHGANYFSGGRVAVFRIDLGAYDEVFSNQIPGFYAQLKSWLPGLREHHCSVGQEGGFLKRVKQGTLLGHIMEHIAIELHTMAGMDVGYGKTRGTGQAGVYNVVFRIVDEVVGIYAGRAALNIVNAILLGRAYDIDEAVRQLVLIREQRLLGPSTQAIVDEARARRIPYLRLDAYNLVQLGTGRYLKRIRATIPSTSGNIAVETADDKHLTNRVLADAGVPVPRTIMTDRLEEVLSFQQELADAVVIKPCRGHLGWGVSVNLREAAEIGRAFEWARQYDDRVLAQAHVAGETFRLLLIDYRLVAAARLAPPAITGDGVQTVGQLIELLNREPDRGIGDKTARSVVEADEITLKMLSDRGLGLDSIPPAGERIPLKVSGNLRLGGSATDVTDQVHPMNRFLAERAVRVLGLDVAGVDFITADIGRSLLETGGVCVEVNAAPDFRLHLQPTVGQPRNVARSFVEMLFPPGTKTRVPIFSVTGTAGKTTTVFLLAHCLKLAGYTPGVTSTDGLFVGDRRLMAGDMTYPEHVALVLKDPTLDCAVLETSREGILRRGLGYDLADVGIVLNVFDDHVGSDDISRLDDLAYAKSVVAEQVYEDGHAVLNADNDLVMEMRERVGCDLVLFARSAKNARVRAHLQKGGAAVVIDGQYVTMVREHERVEVIHLEDVPLSFGGRARLNFDAILAATAALAAYGLPLETIRQGLRTFRPDPASLPGRMNLIPWRDGQVLLDYAHNRAAFESLQEFLRSFQRPLTGVLDAPGDRADEEIVQLGRLAGETYQDLYLYEDHDRRGRQPGEIPDLLARGAALAGFPAERLRRFETPGEAIRAALAAFAPGDLLVVLGERHEEALRLLESLS